MDFGRTEGKPNRLMGKRGDLGFGEIAEKKEETKKVQEREIAQVLESEREGVK